MIRRHLPVIVATALILTGGAVHGYKVNRWGFAPELRRAVADLHRLPLNLGAWEGEDVAQTDEQRARFAAVECEAWLARRYVHRPTGEEVALLILAGPTGPIATHDPRSCYGGNGYELAVPPRRDAVPDGPGPDAPTADFWVGDFQRPRSPNPVGLKIHWAFRAAGPWEAPDDPRVAYAAARSLFKLYAVRELAMTPGETASDPVTPRFLEALLPELDRLLFPGANARDTPGPGLPADATGRLDKDATGGTPRRPPDPEAAGRRIVPTARLAGLGNCPRDIPAAVWLATRGA